MISDLTIPVIPAGWDLLSAVLLCCQIEAIAPEFGAHIGLTGGCLYGDRSAVRKDVDVVVYRIRQRREIEKDKLLAVLRATLGIEIVKDWGFVVKARQGSRSIDFLFPEDSDGGYIPK